MEISRTTLKTTIRYLQDAAEFYREHASKPKEQDRARLIRQLVRKLERMK